MKTTFCVPAVVACLAGALSLSSAPARTITDFDQASNEKLGWSVVNDGVMGGLSKGKLSFNKGVMRFEGNLSLENNGGFSSIRTRGVKLDLSDSAGLIARVKGDGRTYQLRLGSDARYRGMEVSFMAEFPTKKGEWIEVKVPFDELVGSWRGRMLKDEVFNPAKVQRVGMLLADKKSGPFKLEVDWLRAYTGTAGNIVETALADGRFKTLATALTKAELVEAVSGKGPLTVFAPTDKAFAKLPKGTVENLLKSENRDQLQAILKYHVVAGQVDLAGALKAGKATTLQGDGVNIAFADGKVKVNDSAIMAADIECSNGIIHVIDSVLLPPAPEAPANDILGVAKSAGKFGTLLAAVEAAGLTSAIAGDGPFTVLAPTDEAFAALPEGTVESLLKKENLDQLKSILAYHVFAGKVSAGDALNARQAKTLNGKEVKFGIDGGKFKANGATIVATDIKADNGVIHIVDAVLLPPTEQASKTDCKSDCAPAVVIEEAIERGVPIFNKGDHKQCAEIYRGAIEALASDERIKDHLRKGLKMVLDRAEKMGDSTDQAWLYRRALDHSYESVTD